MCESSVEDDLLPGPRLRDDRDAGCPACRTATKSAASLPSARAAMRLEALDRGSSSQTSSPTSARAIASRIAGVGCVSVSERRSTTSCISALPPGPAAAAGAPAPLRVRVLRRQPAQNGSWPPVLPSRSSPPRARNSASGTTSVRGYSFSTSPAAAARRAVALVRSSRWPPTASFWARRPRQMSIFASASVA